MDKLVVVALLDATLLVPLSMSVFLYHHLYRWIHRRMQEGQAKLKFLVFILHVIGVMWMLAGLVAQIGLGYWSDPWPLIAAYDVYVERWLISWLIVLLPGVPALYQLGISARFPGAQRVSQGRPSTTWIIGYTAVILTCVLVIPSLWSVRWF